jgi:hypothetical protein
MVVMAREVKAGEPVAARRRVYWQIVGTDGISPALAEAGGQPQISTNGGVWTGAGIGTLVAIGSGRYYADPTQGAVANVGDVIETRYKSPATAECPGDTVRVVAYDPDSDLAAVKGKTDALGAGQVTLISPVSVAGDRVEIRAGDDYLAADGRAIDFSAAGWPDLTGGSVAFALHGSSYQGSIPVHGSGSQTVRWEPSKAVTSGLRSGTVYAVATLANSDVVTLLSARVDVS